MNIPVTEWFPAEVKPTIPGYYQRKYPGFDEDEDFQKPDYFDGEDWLICPAGGHNMFKEHKPCSFSWRGLAEQPK